MSEEDGRRLSCHHGRYKSHGHNDRQYSEGNIPPHIDPSKTCLNVSWNCYPKLNLTEDQAILKYYSYKFGTALNEQNERYMDRRQKGRIRTMEQYLNVRQHQPEETLLYIGNRNFDVDRDLLWQCYYEYECKEMEWSAEHKNSYFVLTCDLHCDEQGAPHVHERGVWQYQDERGVWHEGQEKALEQAGIPLPDPSAPKGKYNNRKMTFDTMRRQWFIDICKEHGLEIIEEPIKGRQNKKTEEYVRKQVEEQNKKLQDVNKELQEAQKRLEALQGDIEGLEGKKTHLERSESAEEVLEQFDDMKRREDRQLGG